MIIAGDSHVRSYNGKFSKVVPVYLESGKKINLTRIVCFINLFRKWLLINRLLKRNIGIILGEPDVRYFLYRSWRVPSGEKVLYSKKNKIISKLNVLIFGLSFKIFIELLFIFRCPPKFIIGIGTPNPEMLKSSKRINLIMRSVCGKYRLPFFDPLEYIYEGDKISTNYISKSVLDERVLDWVHLSEKIDKSLDEFFKSFFPLDTSTERICSKSLIYDYNFNCYRVIC